ncbi:SPX domain-containing protein [Kalaharituber pfeilii]|nr:SPX domain-containing protein [Kalaharituber pfeilii]
MKFSHSIQFNAVPDWSSHYIAYSSLKKLLYTLEKQIFGQDSEAPLDSERSALLSTDHPDPDTAFKKALDHELQKITAFYMSKEKEIFREVDLLLRDMEEYERDVDAGYAALGNSDFLNGQNGGRRPSVGDALATYRLPSRRATIDPHDDDSDDDDDEDGEYGNTATLLRRARKRPSTIGRHSQYEGESHSGLQRRSSATGLDDYQKMKRNALFNMQISLGKRAISTFVSLRELKSFIQLNKTGFSKALKKYDKTLDKALRAPYMENVVAKAYPFQDGTINILETKISMVENLYAKIATEGDIDIARRELRLHLREHVVWERNTVWREMIGIERKAQAANMGLKRTLLGSDPEPGEERLQGDDPEKPTGKTLRTPLGTVTFPSWLFSGNFFVLVGCVAIFVLLLASPIMNSPEQQNCLAMLVFVSLLWATEVIPLFVTSLLIPFLVVLLGVLRTDTKPHERLNPKDSAKYIFAAMWTPVIMLLLGGFAIAAALSKYDIAKMMATFVLSKAGTRPRTVLLTNMFVSMFLSMWISNVAAPVLCYSIIQPLLRNLPVDSKFPKALILGIALASNIGGMASPIASPQNIIALQNMRPAPNWLLWFFITIPVCVISIVLIWLLLLITFRPSRGTVIVPIRAGKDKFTGVQYFVTIVTIVTIGLWCISHQLEHVFGDMGVVAVIPLVLFFGTGILTKEDFNNFLWTIIILAAGGLSLGKAVNSSGLLHTIAQGVKYEVSGLSVYGVLVTFAGLILLIATFISHTVAALIILPIVAQVGRGMEDPHPNLLVMGSALMCSAAMGLPTSGFPNMTAIMTENPHSGQRYLRVKHFLTRGVPSSVLTFFVVVTIGYGLMRIAGL